MERTGQVMTVLITVNKTAHFPCNELPVTHAVGSIFAVLSDPGARFSKVPVTLRPEIRYLDRNLNNKNAVPS